MGKVQKKKKKLKLWNLQTKREVEFSTERKKWMGDSKKLINIPAVTFFGRDMNDLWEILTFSFILPRISTS